MTSKNTSSIFSLYSTPKVNTCFFLFPHKLNFNHNECGSTLRMYRIYAIKRNTKYKHQNQNK